MHQSVGRRVPLHQGTVALDRNIHGNRVVVQHTNVLCGLGSSRVRTATMAAEEATSAQVENGNKAVTSVVAAESENGNGAEAPGDEVDLEGLEPTVEYVGSSKPSFGTSARLAFALPWRRIKKNSVLNIEIKGELNDKRQGVFSKEISVPELCDCLEKAAYDPRIACVLLDIKPIVAGWARLTEVKRYMELFKKSGKPIIAYMETVSEKEYYLACLCDKLYLTPEGRMVIKGFQVKGQYFKGSLNKVGISPNFRARGKYKSAVEQFSAEGMSEPAEEQLVQILDRTYDHYLSHVAEARGTTPEKVAELIDEGTVKPQDFVDGGWLTGLKYQDELEEELAKITGAKDADSVKFVNYKKYTQVGRSAFQLDGKDQIAVLRAVGPIIGDSGPNVSSAVTPTKLIRTLRALGKNKKVKGVVLRVASPGGDSLASDLMYREIKKLAEKKPVVASMGDVAASGGYYMAMACPTIVAEEMTITGSIGVLGGKFTTEELQKKIGFKSKVITRGEYVELFSPDKSFDAKELAKYDEYLDFAYDSFRNKAAASRGMEPADMEKLAQGRVWMGAVALEQGLVDVMGGVDMAVKVAKRMAGIPDANKVLVKEVNRPENQPLATALAGFSGISVEDAQDMLEMLEGDKLGPTLGTLFRDIVLLIGLQLGIEQVISNREMLTEQGKLFFKVGDTNVEGVGATMEQSGVFSTLFMAPDFVVQGAAELASIPQHLLDLVQSQLGK